MNTMLRNTSSAIFNKTCTGNSTVYGCGLSYLRSKLEEHHSDEGKRFNKLSIRLIGEQAIVLARHCYRLIDCLASDNETEGEKLKRLALSKIAEYLRNAGALFNKIHVQCLGEIDQLDEFCQHYFNMLVLFFPESINVTVWTVAYAIPYHARKLYDKYGIGFGILSLQAKESKHAGLKAELSLTNRSRKCDNNGKWWHFTYLSTNLRHHLMLHIFSPGNRLTVMILFIVTVVERRPQFSIPIVLCVWMQGMLLNVLRTKSCHQKLLQYSNPLLAVYVTNDFQIQQG